MPKRGVNSRCLWAPRKGIYGVNTRRSPRSHLVVRRTLSTLMHFDPRRGLDFLAVIEPPDGAAHRTSAHCDLVDETLSTSPTGCQHRKWTETPRGLACTIGPLPELVRSPDLVTAQKVCDLGWVRTGARADEWGQIIGWVCRRSRSSGRCTFRSRRPVRCTGLGPTHTVQCHRRCDPVATLHAKSPQRQVKPDNVDSIVSEHFGQLVL
jgi:hypothetical protein